MKPTPKGNWEQKGDKMVFVEADSTPKEEHRFVPKVDSSGTSFQKCELCGEEVYSQYNFGTGVPKNKYCESTPSEGWHRCWWCNGEWHSREEHDSHSCEKHPAMPTPSGECVCHFPEFNCPVHSAPSEGWVKTLEENRYGDKYVTANKGMRTLTLIDYISELIATAKQEARQECAEKIKEALEVEKCCYTMHCGCLMESSGLRKNFDDLIKELEQG